MTPLIATAVLTVGMLLGVAGGIWLLDRMEDENADEDAHDGE